MTGTTLLVVSLTVLMQGAPSINGSETLLLIAT